MFSTQANRPLPRFVGDRGQVVPLMAFVLAIALVMVVVLARVGGQVEDRAKAQAAADATALAGVIDGEDAAGAIADSNNAVLVSYVARGGEVEVVVKVGQSTATARSRSRW